MTPILFHTAHPILKRFFQLLFGLRVKGAEVVPEKGRIILASNHISGWDPPVLGVSTTREVHFLAKKELFAVPGLGWLIRILNAIPIDRGAGDVRALKTFISILNQEAAVILFPEGTRSKTGELGTAREGVGLIAMKTNSDIIPVYISGTRKIKNAIFRKPRLRVIFGNRIYLKDYEHSPLEGKDLYKQISTDVLKEIQRLKDENRN
ncbi:1-acyl-sn-glycerol-3-phosphate acyltransferase [candidate division KSB1 bacterium]|nr:1-acyl-sn-glycerol-3-phosphate acyltransferase [candidate division KSB1 bacterium]